MKRTDFAETSTSAPPWLPCCLALLFAFVGCSEEANVLRNFNRLENEALKYGTVSVGAARVTPYDDPNLEESRDHLKDALWHMRTKWLKEPNTAPQGYWASYAGSYFEVMLSFAKALEKSKQKDPSTYFAGLSKAYEDMMKKQPPRPREIELIGYYMAAQKFVESELEELNLGTPTNSDFRRLVVSLDLTAWVRGKTKAAAALVYIDLYPYNADDWCDKAAKILKHWRDELKDINTCEKAERRRYYEDIWRGVTKKELGAGFVSFDPLPMKMPPDSEINEEDPRDFVGFCHRWLARKRLLPRIIQVERMGQGEYLILGEGSYSGTEFQVGGAHPAGFSGNLRAGTARKTEGRTAKVLPLSLAFVAGERRAGWLFMPGKTTEGKMSPTERRLRMVVDVPAEMSILTIHVHKLFLDRDLDILPGATFEDQMANLQQTRRILIYTNKPCESCQARESPRWFPNECRLIKTRVRNLLHQGWSEEIVVDIPTK
jgi:hypothetical protein